MNKIENLFQKFFIKIILFLNTAINLQNNIFYSTSGNEHEFFSHLLSKQIIYYLDSQVSISVNSMNSMNMIILHSMAFKIYKILTDKRFYCLFCIVKYLNKMS